MKFVRVEERAERIAVIGTGESLKDKRLDFPEHVRVIAINQAIKYLPRVDFWFTLDHSPVNLAIERAPRKGTTYYHAAPMELMPSYNHVRYLRRVTGGLWGRFMCKDGLPDDKGVIHTGNSGWGGFQLACHMEPEKVALFGLDGGGGYHYGGAPKVLAMMPELFQSSVDALAERDIKVRNGSPISTITCFEKLSVEEAIKWVSD